MTKVAPLALPQGWEQLQTEDGKTYYVDHNTQQTHWEPPMAADEGKQKKEKKAKRSKRKSKRDDGSGSSSSSDDEKRPSSSGARGDEGCFETLWKHDKANLLVALVGIIGAVVTLGGALGANKEAGHIMRSDPWIIFLIPACMVLGGCFIILVGSGLKNEALVAVGPFYLCCSGLVVYVFWIIAFIWLAAIDFFDNVNESNFSKSLQAVFAGVTISGLTSMMACCTAVYRWNTVRSNRRKERRRR